MQQQFPQLHKNLITLKQSKLNQDFETKNTSQSTHSKKPDLCLIGSWYVHLSAYPWQFPSYPNHKSEPPPKVGKLVLLSLIADELSSPTKLTIFLSTFLSNANIKLSLVSVGPLWEPHANGLYPPTISSVPNTFPTEIVGPLPLHDSLNFATVLPSLLGL